MRLGAMIGTTLAAATIAAGVWAAESGPGQTPAGAQNAGTPASAATRPALPASQPAGFSVRGVLSFPGPGAAQRPDLARAVIYLAAAPALDAGPRQDAPVQIAQRDKMFVPDLVVVRRGGVVEFPNWDHFAHNVFSLSRCAPPFDLDRYDYGQSKSHRFDLPGIVQVFCNAHSQMKAVIVVTPNGYFTRPDDAGRFELRGVPAGRYELVAWHERFPERRCPITVGPADAEVALQLVDPRKSILTEWTPDKPWNKLPVVKDVHAAPADPK